MNSPAASDALTNCGLEHGFDELLDYLEDNGLDNWGGCSYVREDRGELWDEDPEGTIDALDYAGVENWTAFWATIEAFSELKK